ncbi:MAG: two component transcriptional regulator, LuxR family [Frankiales bacterium]|nr:two component transcriptional regulator, LuxR family [Frankiales bacterium]
MGVSVLLVDDHALIRQGLRRAFEATDDLVVVAEAGSLSEALALSRAHSPDVAVVDVNLGDGSGIEFVRTMRQQRPEMGLVVLTMYDGDEHVFAALEAGASSFVLKGAPSEDVVNAARQSASAPTAFTAQDLAGAMRRRMQTPAVSLTPRENEILQLLGNGSSVAQIAAQLYISQSTAKTHMAKLYDKLGAGNRTQAVMSAVRLGLLSTDAR